MEQRNEYNVKIPTLLQSFDLIKNVNNFEIGPKTTDFILTSNNSL